MARPQRDHAWLRQRGGIWYICWYSPSGRETKRRSLQTTDRTAAEAALAAFNADYQGRPVDGGPGASWRSWALKMCRRARENAKQKGRSYDITPEYVLHVLNEQGFRCAVTNMRFSTAETYRNPFAPSLDQIQPGGGYTPGNVRVVTVIANTAMNGWGEAALRRLILESRLTGQWLIKNEPDCRPNVPKFEHSTKGNPDKTPNISET